MSAPRPTPLYCALHRQLKGNPPPSGFTLMEMLLVVGGLSLLSAGGFVVYQSATNNANVRTEQDNVQRLASNADRVYGVLGSYQGLTTAKAVATKLPPSSMVAGTGLVSRWKQPVVVAPTSIGATTNAGVKITYQAVPSRACLKFAQAASEGMSDVLVNNQSVMSSGRFDTNAAITKCASAPTSPVAFVYGGSSGQLAAVLAPVALPPLNPPVAPPPLAPPPAPPPAAPPPPPPAPGCGAAPSTAATGTTPPGQTCSFLWTATAAPTCWVSEALCTPVVAPPPVSPPTTPPRLHRRPRLRRRQARCAPCPRPQPACAAAPAWTAPMARWIRPTMAPSAARPGS